MNDNQKVNLFFVSGLPLDVTENEMKEYFLPDHEISHCKLYSTHCGIKSSYGYVGLKSKEIDIQEYVKNKKLKNKDIFIELIDEENESDSNINDNVNSDDHHQSDDHIQCDDHRQSCLKESSSCEQEEPNTNNPSNLNESIFDDTNDTNKNDNICYNNVILKKKKGRKKHIKIINKNGDITKEGLSILENMSMQEVVILIIRIQELVRMDPQTAIKMLDENKTIYYSLVHALFLLGILNVEISPLDNDEIKESHLYQMKNYFQYICMNDKKSKVQDFNEPKALVDDESENYSCDDSSEEYEEEIINEDVISVEENQNEINDNSVIDGMDNTFNSDNIIYDDNNNDYNDDYHNDDYEYGDDYHHNLINKKATHVNKKPLYNNHQPYIYNMKNDKKRKIQDTPKDILNNENYNYGDNNITYEDIYYNMNNDTSMEYNNMKGMNNHNQFNNMRMKNKQKKDYLNKSSMQECIKVNDSSRNNNNNINSMNNNNMIGSGNIFIPLDKRKGNFYGNNRMNMKNKTSMPMGKNINNNNMNNINNINNMNNINNNNMFQKGVPKPLYSFNKNKEVNRNNINYDENDANSGDTQLHNYNNNYSNNNNLLKSNKENKNHNENTHFYNPTNYNANNKQQVYRNKTDLRNDNVPNKLINKIKHTNNNNQRRGIKLIDRKNNPEESNYNENKIKIKCINIEEEEEKNKINHNNNNLMTNPINSNLALLLKKLKISLNDIPYAEDDLIKEIINEKSILQNILISKYVDMLNWTNEQVLRVLSIRKTLKKIGYNINGVI
ncbi:conserved Plasmodium protein, unknown function [Plasmodium sp. gorilla clade G2]|uniref:conserved Plasmodium protein, unknown function n=1 Tax=Plasmodium sp. gorilla clade G2 TaxID=880535 RepID=UPI000D20EDC2|nr:conserved Plasmodium protein, unknown function [Plasmodium sp. gorilla clade G2]SOV15092.1 conserved Plasmodium protein, unknown function [Plasmodium sp. gorilla clade G2]